MYTMAYERLDVKEEFAFFLQSQGAVEQRLLLGEYWTITHDPLRLTLGMKDVYVDLGAERLLAAVKGQQKIAVEVKSFLGLSEIADLEVALGQYTLYHDILAKTEC